MRIRRAEMEDAAAISALILGEASHITLRPDGTGAEAILASMQTPAIQAHLASPRFQYWVHSTSDHIDGVIALRDASHLYHMFVPTPMHGRGIARRLWHHLLAHQPTEVSAAVITVNASPFALPVYERFGFVSSGHRTETNGVAFIPMQYPPSTSTHQGAQI